MKEIKGNLWDYYGKPDHVVLITTNGFIKKNGEAVMGRGCALEATYRFPGLAKELGEWIITNGNVPCWLRMDLATFPVKHNWFEFADLKLIAESCMWLKGVAQSTPHANTYVLPRPGCGNGHLSWDKVKPLLADLPDNVLVIDFER